jgi:hypothetical protein
MKYTEELIQRGGETSRPEIQKLTNYVSNNEEFLLHLKESCMISMCKKCAKAKVQLLYQPVYIIHCVSNLAEEKLCLSIFEFPIGVWISEAFNNFLMAT